MFKIIAAVIIGGNRTFWGPVIGLIVLTVIEEALTGADQLVPMLWGLIIILTVLFLPGGMEGSVQRLLARFGGPLPAQGKEKPDASRA
jgi:branched-chain amino acid transport system permease protein